ncbi:DUF4190 domain-containing protein [Arthrobacter sp. HY1533]|uniref:DUF4190 domain-containing protein n=1 Tax=Arthrobacter sp. HY1533 TaxID=2970919 RepID=UPI0022BA032C|nr:DUF4190 domain-containing protein [Arthrobacter sp. HY1533]
MSQNPENPYGQPQPVPTPEPYTQPVQAPAYGQQPPASFGQQPASPYGQQPSPYGAPPVDPGKTLSIVAIILPFVGFGLVGLILGIVAMNKSKAAGFKNTLALVAVIIGALSVIGAIIGAIVLIVFLNSASEGIDTISQIIQACQTPGTESVVVGATENS